MRLARARAGIALLLFIAISASAQTVTDRFNEANKLYEQQKFPAAAAEYEKLIQSSNISSAIYFNLGNAYFKSGALGRAIAAYRKAGQLSPRDPAIRANLQFARNEAGSKVSETIWQEWIHRFTIDGWTIATTVCIWIFFSLLIAGHWRPDLVKTARFWATASGVAAIFLGVCLAFAARDRFFTNPAVVITQEAVVRRGPFDESQSYFTLRDGAEIFVVDHKDKWIEITDAANRTGWLPESQVIVLNGGR